MKTNEWTYRPKYTRARIINELAEKEQHMASTLVELLRLQTTKEVDIEHIVFDCFLQMIEDLRNSRMEMIDNPDIDMETDGFFARYHNTNAFDCFLANINAVCCLANADSDDSEEKEEDAV